MSPASPNPSSLEVEDAPYHHPAVLLADVVTQVDSTWGGTPCALAGIKVPETSTGKIHKYLLREQAKSASAIA